MASALVRTPTYEQSCARPAVACSPIRRRRWAGFWALTDGRAGAAADGAHAITLRRLGYEGKLSPRARHVTARPAHAGSTTPWAWQRFALFPPPAVSGLALDLSVKIEVTR